MHNSSTRPSKVHRFWRVETLIGLFLVIAGIGCGYIDEATNFDFPVIGDNFEIILTLVISGVVLAFIGCIGWAVFLERNDRIRMALIVFLSPFFCLLIGYFMDGLNVHGITGIFFLLLVPGVILAFILLIMVARGK